MNKLYIFVIIGPVSLIIGILLLIKRKEFVSKSRVISGTVIDTKEGYVNNKKSFFPVIEYYDENNSSKEVFESDTGYNPPKYKVGDIVEVRYYRRGEKKISCLNTWFAIWGGPAIFIPIGALFSIIGVIIVLTIK